MHNIPEGLAISLVLVHEVVATNRSPPGASSSSPQPVMAVPAFLFVETFAEFLPIGLGFAAGAMLWLVASDLLPEALETTGPWKVAYRVGGSALVMLLFVLVLL